MLNLDPSELLAIAKEAHDDYVTAAPFPHRTFDDLFDQTALAETVVELSASGGSWHRTHLEAKRVLNDWPLLGPAARRLATTLNSPPFVDFVEALTGIDALIADVRLERAGYFDVPPGGFLAVHADPSRSRSQLVRRVNVIVYLNAGWQPSYGGALVLYDRAGEPVEHVIPRLGRTIVFDTPGSLHGHPEPVAAPDGRHRLAFSAYYYTSPSLPVPGRVRAPRFVDERALRRLARRWLPPVVMDAVHARREQLPWTW